MCTVSFIPVKDKVFLTSNRDEKAGRQPARHPGVYSSTSCNMLFPQDPKGGGTWITICSNGNAGVLLNGAFENHRPKPLCKKSRGLVLLEIMDGEQPVHNFLRTSLHGIEPFTLIIWQKEKGRLFECRWDDQETKHCRTLPADQPHIWSSATLYDEPVRKKREQWFTRWLRKHEEPEQTDILKFHRFAGEGDEWNDLYMNRDGVVFTVSITGLELGREGGSIHYTDTLTGETVQHSLTFAARDNMN